MIICSCRICESCNLFSRYVQVFEQDNTSYWLHITPQCNLNKSIHLPVCTTLAHKVSPPANTKHLYNICTTSSQRLRRWSNIVQMLYKCFVFAGPQPMHPYTLTQWVVFFLVWDRHSGKNLLLSWLWVNQTVPRLSWLTDWICSHLRKWASPSRHLGMTLYVWG